MRFKEYLAEIFDTKWKHEVDPDMTEKVKNHYATHPSYKGQKYTNVTAHKLEGDNGHMISCLRNGMLEVHHMDKDLDSGEIKNHHKMNTKFVSTMMDHMKTHALDKARPARISATKDMYNHLLPIAHRLAKKHGYHIKETGTENVGGREVHNAEIHHQGKLDSLKEALK